MDIIDDIRFIGGKGIRPSNFDLVETDHTRDRRRQIRCRIAENLLTPPSDNKQSVTIIDDHGTPFVIWIS